jgi:hypothetical protein
MNINSVQVLTNRRRPGLQYPIHELATIKVVPYMVNVDDDIEAAAQDQLYERMYEERLACVEREA